VAMSLLGYFGGHSWEALHRWLGRGGLIILGCVVLLVGLPYLWRRLRKIPTTSWNRLLRAEVWQGVVAAVLVVVCVVGLVHLAKHHKAPPREDREVRDWVMAQHAPALDALAVVGSYLGSLPVVTVLAALCVIQAWRWRRPWREAVAVLGVLVASEAVGLVLLGVLRHEGVEPARALAWPFGFAGLAPLRGMAVFGVIAHIIRRQAPVWGRRAAALAMLLVLLIGFSVVWSHEQYLTEVLIEYAAGGLVLFIGMWWLEGYGQVQAGPADEDGPTVPARP